MKKIIFLTLIISIFLSNFVISCTTSLDNFASEVLLNKNTIDSNLPILDNGDNVGNWQGAYVLQSQYNPNMTIILSQAEEPFCDNCLSVRLQIPAKMETKEINYLSILSYSKSLTAINESNYEGWSITCENKDQCYFKKDNVEIIINKVSTEYEVNLDVKGKLDSCDICNGRCILTGTSSVCIKRDMKTDIERILVHAGVINNFEDLFVKYKLAGYGTKSTEDLFAESEIRVDWKAAMSKDLNWLRKQGIIHLTDSEISEISELADAGKSGQNSRIYYGEQKNGEKKWMYYYQTKLPELTKFQNCKEFPSSLVPKGVLTFPTFGISVYYFVPIVITGILFTIIIILIVVARLTSKPKKAEVI